MTDPVDTDALRDKSNWLGHLDQEFGEQVAAAADEVDRQRDRLHHVENWALPEAIRTWRKQRSEAARLRVVIENAPHAGDCGLNETGYNNQPIGLPCTCWKADAL